MLLMLFHQIYYHVQLYYRFDYCYYNDYHFYQHHCNRIDSIDI